MVSARVSAREAHGPGDAPHRYARGARHHELAARREIAEPHQRADHRADRQQLEHLLRQIKKVYRKASAVL